MEFRRFESAVRRHGSGKYTMCDFLNLIKAAARDISDEYETDVYELARGDESQFADLISNQCFMISEMMDASVSGGSDDRLERLNEEIKELNEQLATVNEMIENTREKIKCPECSTYNARGAVYCNKCGKKLPAAKPAGEDEFTDEELLSYAEETIDDEPHGSRIDCQCTGKGNR